MERKLNSHPFPQIISVRGMVVGVGYTHTTTDPMVVDDSRLSSTKAFETKYYLKERTIEKRILYFLQSYERISPLQIYKIYLYPKN